MAEILTKEEKLAKKSEALSHVITVMTRGSLLFGHEPLPKDLVKAARLFENYLTKL